MNINRSKLYVLFKTVSVCVTAPRELFLQDARGCILNDVGVKVL